MSFNRLNGKYKLKGLLAAFLLIACLAFGESSLPDYQLQQEEPNPSNFKSGAWSIVVLPDTQYYASRNGNNHKILNTMMDWIVAEKDKRNIEMVVHVGDMTNNNSIEQWKRIRSSYKRLDNILPYVVCEGNHDRGKKIAKTHKPNEPTMMNDFFKISGNPLNQRIFKESYKEGELQNAYYVFEQNNLNYLFLALEYETPKPVIDWADKVIKNHSDHRVFITVHKYMSEEVRLVSKDGRPDPHEASHSGYDSAGIFKSLAQPNPNVEFIVCGHVGAVKKGTEGKGPKGYEGILVYDRDIATGHRSDAKADGLTVHQMLFNAQWIPNGGDGWMLLLEFQPDNKTVEAKTFSPHLDQWRTGTEFRYTLDRLFGDKKCIAAE